MAEHDFQAADDVSELVQARTASAVLKHRLITLRSTHPDVRVFAFEGVDDLGVYFQWIRRVDETLEYEPFVCSGKVQLLQLWAVVRRDRGSLAKNVFFFVDGDFDDNAELQGSETVYVTDGYSFENHLVSSQVLNELLKNELQCHSVPSVRSPILAKFEQAYVDFLKATAEVNWRIFVAKRSGIERTEDLPKNISKLVKIELERISGGSDLPSTLVVLEREPTDDEIEKWRPEFDELEPALRYRGKFALNFFKRWLSELVKDWHAQEPKYFSAVKSDLVRVRSAFNYDNLAPKATVPESLRKFLLRAAEAT